MDFSISILEDQLKIEQDALAAAQNASIDNSGLNSATIEAFNESRSIAEKRIPELTEAIAALKKHQQISKMMNIQQEIAPHWDDIVKVDEEWGGGIASKELQYNLERAMINVIPQTVGYNFEWNYDGVARHVFFEKANPENKYIIE